jgi:hypothetical protein
MNTKPHVKTSRSTRVRIAMTGAIILGAALTACVEQPAMGPEIQQEGRVRLSQLAQTNDPRDFFSAWSRGYSSYPIQTQMFALDDRQDRQYVDWYPTEEVLAFARAYPGHLYINGDEPDQWCMAPNEYAAMYHNFVTKVRAADPTARVSPAGFAEPNARCCADENDEACKLQKHSVSYAEQFYQAYKAQYGTPPRVDEWRFHDFGVAFQSGDLEGWWARINKAAEWSIAHGANMVLGGWGFHGWREPVPVFREHLKQAMGRLAADTRINGAVYWSYEPWIESPRPLVNEVGALTAEGETYANPLTDVPVNLKLVGSPDGYAKLRWSNTTSAWGAQIEFYYQPPGTNSWEYLTSHTMSNLGAAETPFVELRRGDLVKARVRYYSRHGASPWSPFSNTALLALSDAGPIDRKPGRNQPLFCFLRLC